MCIINLFIIVLIIIAISLSLYSHKTEPFGWNCTFTPNKDYYKQDWILGDNPLARALARDSIKSYP